MRTRLAVTLAGIALAALPAPALGANATILTTVGASPPFAFMPSAVTVDVGSSVTVSKPQEGGVPHDLIWDDGSPGVAMDPRAGNPDNVDAWTSPPRTFTAPGDYAFHCSFHGALGMTGVVHVAAAVGATSTPAPAAPVVQQPSTTAAPPDTTAPRFSQIKGRATRRAVTVRLRLSERATVTIAVRRGSRTVKKRVFRNRRAGVATLRVPVRLAKGRVTVRITARDAAGNTVRRTLRRLVR